MSGHIIMQCIRVNAKLTKSRREYGYFRGNIGLLRKHGLLKIFLHYFKMNITLNCNKRICTARIKAKSEFELGLKQILESVKLGIFQKHFLKLRHSFLTTRSLEWMQKKICRMIVSLWSNATQLYFILPSKVQECTRTYDITSIAESNCEWTCSMSICSNCRGRGSNTLSSR